MRERIRRRLPEDGQEGRVCWDDTPLDMILDCWLPIATVAWEGFLQHGRGTVYLRTAEGSAEILYRAGSHSRSQKRLVESYDPARQAVVLVLDEDEEETSVHLADGWPSPPEAMGITTADDVDETIH